MSTQSRRAAFVLLGLILTYSLRALSAEPNLAGAWTATIDMPSRGTRTTTLQLEQDGQKLSGHIVDSSGKNEPISGTVIGAQIQFSYSTSRIKVRTDSGDVPLTLSFSGTANDNEIDVKAPSPLGETSLKATKK